MHDRETPAPTPEARRRPNAMTGWEGRRPTLRRFPLIAFLATGLICLNYLDGRLSNDHKRSAADLAVQADALIEGAVSYRAASVHALRQLVASAPTAAEQRSRFSAFGHALTEATPEIIRIYRLDNRGDVRDYVPRDSSGDDLAKENHLLLAETAAALARARAADGPASTGVIALRNETLGFVIYDAVIVDGQLDGYVAAAVAYGPLLRAVMTPRLQGRFGYRIADSAGRVLAVSPTYPTRISSFATQDVQLPGSGSWRFDVPVGVFQPRAARVTMWIVGVVLLCLVLLLVLREDARAERIAMHSFNLELVSRDLLDANVRLEERAQQVTEANMAKSRFLANVSHELRTPLNAIVGYNALALSGLYGEVAPELRGAHDRIRAAADHLLRVVNDVLDLSKIEVGRMEVDLRPVALEPLLDAVVAIVEPVAEAKDVRIDLVVARDLPDIVTDARHLRQILMNLTTNAIKFTERGSVTIVARRGDGADARAASITIEDTGIGIAEPDLDRIFDEFEQVKPSARGDSISRGTGLGLAVSRKLARLIGGDVRVESHLGAGSRFTLTVPFEPGPEVAALAHERSGASFHERRRRESETGGSRRPEGAEPPVEAGPRP
jgi:signal transduction histidine kinase